MITRQALGRIAQLGDLYDVHTDCFCGRVLFSGDLPENTIRLTNTPKTACEYVIKDSINEKFKKLDVEAELKASILSGTIEVNGHGKYLSTNDSTARETSATLVCKMTTKHEAIKIDNKEAVSLLSSDVVRSTPNATHVVVEIQWGAVAIATLKCKNEENEKKTDIEAALKAELACLEIAAKGQTSASNSSTSKLHGFQFEFHADVLPDGGHLPQDFDQACEFMRRLPAHVANANNGKGVPIQYTLMPLSAIRTHLDNIESPDRIVNSIDEHAINETVRIFDEMNESMRKLNDVYEDFKKYSDCIMDDVMDSVLNQKRIVERAQADIKTKLKTIIVAIRNGTLFSEEIYNIIKDYENSPASRSKVNDFINSLRSSRDKIDFAAWIQKQGAHYLGREMSLDTLRMRNKIKECYVFFCSWKDSNVLAKNKKLFTDLVEESNKRKMNKMSNIPCILVDVDLQPEIVGIEGVPVGNRICHYANHSYINTDYLEEVKKIQEMCRFKCTTKQTPFTMRPKNRIKAVLICPLSIQDRYCERKEHEWFCINCDGILQYDFDGNFLCGCGSAPINTFEFKCSDPKHRSEFVSFDKQYLKDCVSKFRSYNKELNTLNILILGETGVGKSTWINGFANYLTFRTLKEAEKGKQVYLVPSQFTITNSSYRMKTIRVGEAKNESFQVGESSTQEPRSYIFNDGKRNICLIDTPGIGDCRGVDQDALNFSLILQYISQIPEIHGICILMKPNNSKMNIVFKYCINELLTHLHVSAANNIAFCFTNARSTFYRPGDTLPVLKKFLKDLEANRGIEIMLNEDTIYCMDNESFRFLCCLHQDEKFNEEERKNFEQSWKLSVEETKRLLKHFEMDIKPHIVEQIISLNEARELILTLAKPLADITQNIQDNIAAINAEEDKIKELDLHSINLQRDLMIPQISSKIKQLDHPRTVCTGVNCIDTETLPDLGVTKTIYRTICHDPCHCCLGNVISETVPNPALQKCNVMDPSSLNCKKCGCSWEMHMHIMFEQEKVEVMVEDPVIKQALQKTFDSRQQQEVLIKSLNDRVEKYKKEQKTIYKICAKFGAFLKENSILPYNDAIEGYLKFNIRELEQQSDSTSSERLQKIERLEEQLEQYRETKRMLDLDMQSDRVKKIEVVEIKKMQKELEQLELTGKEIKKLFDATVCGQQINFYHTERYFDSSQYRRTGYWTYTPNQNNSLLVPRRSFRSRLPQTCSLS